MNYNFKKIKDKWFVIHTTKKNIKYLIKKLDECNIEYFLLQDKIHKKELKSSIAPNLIFIKCNSIEQAYCLSSKNSKINIFGNPFPESIPNNQINKLIKNSSSQNKNRIKIPFLF
jgi:hypothetical protein